MKKYFLVFGFLFISCLSIAQVGINTIEPTETLDANGTMRVRKLPLNGNENVISTLEDGTLSEQKDQSFKAVQTVVADANGVLGVVSGLPVVESLSTKSIAYTAKTAIIDDNVKINSLTKIGNIAVYLEAKSGSKIGYVRFCLVNEITDNVIVNQMKLGSGGGTYGKNESFLGIASNNSTNIASSIPIFDSRDEDTWHRIRAEIPSITNRDYIQYMISLINTREIYRLTAIVNGAIEGTVNSDATVTFFIERLTNQ